MLDRFFRLSENRTTVRTEVLAGLTTFLTMIGIPLSYFIADGLALGFISYPIVKFFSGRRREVRWLTYVLAIALVAYFIFVRAKMG